MGEQFARERVKRLLHRWDLRGLRINDAQAKAAVDVLKTPGGRRATDIEKAQRICNLAVHPVLEQPIPSAFRVCSLLPVTAFCSIAMISTKSFFGSIFLHWMYQTHSAGTRYCNYADTSRDLDPKRMAMAYAASTVAACGVAIGANSLAARIPRLRLVGLIVPHTAVACAGAISTVMNAEVELREGIRVHDAHGVQHGVSVAAAQTTVTQAVLLHGVLVPSCALLLPVAAMRGFLYPRLMATAPHMLMPAATATVVGSTCLITPLAAACVPPIVELSADRLEPELQQPGASSVLYGGKALY